MATAKKATSNEVKKTTTLRKVEEVTATVTAKVEKVDKLAMLVNRFNFLKQKRTSLDKFISTSDGSKEVLTLSNGQGEKFEVSNTGVIEKTVSVLQEELHGKIQETEYEILNFDF